MVIYKSLSDRLKNQHEAIEHIIAFTYKECLKFQPAEGKWSAHDNIAHLAKYQPIFLERINQILTEDSPYFERYKAEDDPEFENWRNYSQADLLKALNSDREAIFNLISGLNEMQLKRFGHHKKFGKLTIVQWTEFFLLHEAHHIFTVFQLVNNAEVK